jgi:hypothetical protein
MPAPELAMHAHAIRLTRARIGVSAINGSRD